METTHLRLRRLELSDYEEIAALMSQVYPDLGGAWSEATIRGLIQVFPEGQLGIEDNGKLVAGALTIKVSYEHFSNPHRYEDVITDYRWNAHDVNGDALYGIDVFVSPQYRGLRLGRRLYAARKELCRDLNLRAILAGGRMPGFDAHFPETSPSEYIKAVKQQKLWDPILSFQIANGFDVKRLLRRYMPEDEKSHGYATLLEWNNILYHNEESDDPYPPCTTARIGLVQRQMRSSRSVEDLLGQIEFFVDTLSHYRADFAVLPEFFSAPLIGLQPGLSSTGSIRFLSTFSEQLRMAISEMAVSYNINIVAGSMPVEEEGKIFNISYLCRRDGTVEEQRKIHVTPEEKRSWNLEGGNQLRVFATDSGRVAILLCYDIEFPELGRLAAEQGVEILITPFWTETKNAYLRVRHCAQARAIENECYVALAGSVGNLPRVDTVDIQYAQSAVFTPSDYYFPHDGILTEAVANTEMVLFADVDLEKLKLLHQEGSVTNLRDRRTDLYEVRAKKIRTRTHG